MSRVSFARQIQFYKSKINRENKQLEVLEQALSNETANKSNKNRLYHLLKGYDQMIRGKEILGKNYNGALFGLSGMQNNWNNLIQNGLYHSYYGNTCIGSNIYNGMCDMFGLSNSFLNDTYRAFADYNDYNDLYEDNALSDMKTDDIEAQKTYLKSQLQADTAELKSLEEAEKNAIDRSASKYA